LKTLYLLRHAKAVSDAPGGDAERPLAKRGRKAAKRMGDFIAGLNPRAEAVLCSPALRTRETLDMLLPALDPAPAILYEEELYLADAGSLFERLRKLPKALRSVLLIGHNPGLHELGVRLAAEPGRLAEKFPTAALAAFDLDMSWAELRWRSATLTLFRTPKELGRDPAAE